MSHRVYIVRHGNTFDKGDTVLRVGGRTDLPLSSSGRDQAQALARDFHEQGIIFGRALVGPLHRTRETADAILASQPSAPPVEIEEGLREVDYGPDEGQPEDQIIARIGEGAIEAWEQRFVVPDGWLVDVRGIRSWWQALFEGLAAASLTSPTLVVTSNGVARFAICERTLPQVTAAKLRTGAYGVMSISASGQIDIEEWDRRPALK